MESFRKQDMKAEQQLAKFMDENFYSKLSSRDGGVISFTRYQDKESQLRGMDVCIEVQGKKHIIDEKASLYYCNAMIPTFAFELDSIQRGHKEPVEGWFVNDELMSEYYMLIWPNVKCDNKNEDKKWIRKDINVLDKSDFTIVEAMLIGKKDLRAVFEEQGFSREALIEYAKKFRKENVKETSKVDEKLMKYVTVSYSGQLAEKPINLVVRKELLKTIAKGIYLISEDGYATIKG